jgi:hypothetical protein
MQMLDDHPLRVDVQHPDRVAQAGRTLVVLHASDATPDSSTTQRRGTRR